MPSSLHPASLVHASLHSTATLRLVDLALNDCLIDYVVQCTVEAVDFALGRASSFATPNPKDVHHHAEFTEFVSNVLSRSEMKTPVILASLVYIHRAMPYLSIATEQWACERVFLGALILAAKYTNDSTLRNVHWALCTGVFGKRDVGRIEREFLQVLNWDLSISEDDILSHHHSFHSLYTNPLDNTTPKSPLVATTSPDCSRSLDMEDNEISSWSDSDDSCSSDSSQSPITPPLNLTGHESYSRQAASSGVTPSRPCRPVDLGLPGVLDILNSFPLPSQWCSPASLVDGKRCESQNPISHSTRIWL